MNSYMILAFVVSAMAHSHGHHSSSHHSSSGESGSSSGSGTTHSSHRKFTYKIAATKAAHSSLVSYFITRNFIDAVQRKYNYDNDNNFTTYNIYYYIENDDSKCIYFNGKLNNLDYTFIDYSNINLINNKNMINYSLINMHYCEKIVETNYEFMIFITILIIICCCFCCSRKTSKRSLH